MLLRLILQALRKRHTTTWRDPAVILLVRGQGTVQNPLRELLRVPSTNTYWLKKRQHQNTLKLVEQVQRVSVYFCRKIVHSVG